MNHNWSIQVKLQRQLKLFFNINYMKQDLEKKLLLKSQMQPKEMKLQMKSIN